MRIACGVLCLQGRFFERDGPRLRSAEFSLDLLEPSPECHTVNLERVGYLLHRPAGQLHAIGIVMRFWQSRFDYCLLFVCGRCRPVAFCSVSMAFTTLDAVY